ncbi:MAG: hypothetical protein AB7P03_30895 [Kofleriaceae bacterium]
MVLIASLLAGGAVLVSLQTSATRSTDLARSGMTALYCAEAGLSAARPVIAENYAQWNASLSASAGGDFSEPSWLSSAIGSHDLDGDGVADYSVYIRDNDDEQSPLTNNTAVDNDLQVFIISQCTKYPETPKQVAELVLYNGASSCYPWQIGGCGGDGNNATK